MTIDQSLRRDLLKTTAPPQGKHSDDSEPLTGLDLDQHLVSSSKQVLLKKIDFQPAERDVSFQLMNLRVKYVPLNPAGSGSTTGSSAKSNNHNNMGTPEVTGKATDGIPAPKRVLCQPEVVTLNWQKCHRIGAGLINMGNTCFLNSVLQCITYTPPLVNYLFAHHAKEQCRELGFCMMCALQTHIQRAFQHNQPAIRPMVILNKLKHIAKHMHQGRQEDAHEFLRYLIEAMQKSSVNGLEKLDRLSKETTIVYQIFGGYYRSRVTCSVCQGKSDTYDPFLDIGLDIKHAPSVNKAFERLIRPETLDGENAYQCKRCNREVQAQKRFTIHRAPKILTLCLKRFDFNRFSMGKIHKDVTYTEYLNLRPYMSDPKGPHVPYKLYAVLKHEGASCNSGHYYCYVKGANESWYCMNDAYISQCGLNRVLNQNAYLLFYVQKEVKTSINGDVMGKDSKAAVPVKQHPATSTKPANPCNGPLGSTVNRSSFIGPTKPKIIADQPMKKQVDAAPPAVHATLPKVMPLPDQRNKLSFTMRQPGVTQNTGSKLVVKPSVPNSSHAIKSPAVAGKSGKEPSSVSLPSPSTISKPPVFSAPSKAKLLTPTSKSKPLTPTTKSKLLTPTSKSKLQGLVKPKAEVAPTPAKPGFMGLVPYSAEDSNSSSDSENYDAVAEQLSKSLNDTTSLKIENKTDSVPNDKASASQEDRTPKCVDHSDMKPPMQTVILGDVINGTPKKRSLANGTDLTVLRKPDSPLKLTITTNGNAQRLKATGHWRISDVESQVSPSPASDSSIHSNHSNVSTNSTSEWLVLEKKDAPSTPQKIKEEAAVYGWNITPSKLELMRSFSDPGGIGKSAQNEKSDVQIKQVKEAEDKELGEVRTSNWLVNKQGSGTADNITVFGLTAKQNKIPSDSVVPRNLTGVFQNNDELANEGTELKKTKDESHSSLPSQEVDLQRTGMNDTDDIVQKKKKHKKQKRDAELEQVDDDRCEENINARAVTDKAKSPDAEEGDSGYYSIKSKNHDSDLEEEDEEEEDLSRKPKKHKHKKKKKRPHEDDDGTETCDTHYENQEYGPELPATIKKQNIEIHQNDIEYGPKSPEPRHKHKSHEHRLHSPDYKHKSESEQRLKSPEHKHRHNKSNDRQHHFRSPDRDNAGHKPSSSLGHEHKNRHRSFDHVRHIRSPDFDRHLKFPNHDRVRSPDYEQWHKKHRGSDSENAKHRTYVGDKLRYSSDESDKHHSKFSVNRTSDDEDHSYAKRIKDKKRKRKRRDRDEFADRGDGYNDRDGRKDDYRQDKGDVQSRLESPTKKRKPVKDGNMWEDSESNGKGYGDERRKSDGFGGKSKHDAPTQQWDHHIQEGYKRSHDDSSLSRLGASWDGKRSFSSFNVVEELNQSSMRAYGPFVSSWDGGRSAIDDEIEKEARTDRIRDPYDVDFDRGKVKKVKVRYESDSNKHGGHYNPFQAEQNRRNKGHFYEDHYNRYRPYPKKTRGWHGGHQQR